DSEFYQKLAGLDRGIADRWRSATGGKLSTTIGPTALEAIIVPTWKAKKITASQAQALAMLFSTKLSQDAGIELVLAINIAYDNDFFFKGSAKPLITRQDLQPFNAALGMGNIGKNQFCQS